MIARLVGTLVSKRPPWILMDVNGVGYEIEVPMSTLYGMPEAGGQITLLTHLVVRDDAHVLYGFASDVERAAFRQLLRVPGVGPKMALSVLSGLTVAELSQAVAMQEPGRLTRIPGIGRKTAERLLLELKGKIADGLPGAERGASPDASADIANALAALGYNDREIAAAVRELPAGTGVTEGIRQALKALSKA